MISSSSSDENALRMIRRRAVSEPLAVGSRPQLEFFLLFSCHMALR